MSDVAIAWLMQQPGVTSVITGFRSPDQVTKNLAAVDLQLPSDTIQALNDATAVVKQAIGSNPDLWQSQTETRFH